jgi:hypothetical protein
MEPTVETQERYRCVTLPLHLTAPLSVLTRACKKAAKITDRCDLRELSNELGMIVFETALEGTILGTVSLGYGGQGTPVVIRIENRTPSKDFDLGASKPQVLPLAASILRSLRDEGLLTNKELGRMAVKLMDAVGWRD